MIAFLSLISICIQLTQCYKGVMLVPGFNFNMTEFEILSDAIKQEHPGTDVVIGTFASGQLTGISMWAQVYGTYQSKEVTEFLKRNSDGFHLFAHSMGSVISRAMIEYYGLPVINYIVAAGVNMGYYGVYGRWGPTIDELRVAGVVNLTVQNAYTVFYNDVSQNTIFIAGVWRDPCHLKGLLGYEQRNKFLAIINNEATHENAEKFKKNFSNITNLYLYDGPDDDVVSPWRSGHFEFIHCNGSAIPMKNLRVYKEDLFGLRTLDERNAIFHQEFPQTLHGAYITVPFFQEHFMHLLT